MFAAVQDLAVVHLDEYSDERGCLVPLEVSARFNFVTKRLFYVRGVPAGTVRGHHAHARCSQILICQSGSIALEMFDGKSERSVRLGKNDAIFIPIGIFASERYEVPETTLLVLCDRPFEPEEFIRTREDLIAFRAG